jgi:hypothetical protein
MLQARSLVRTGGARERLEALVDLQRVGRDRDRVLAAVAQDLRQLDRDRGLADARRAEYGDYVRQATRASRDSSPASVVLVPCVISTSTSSPGWATPVKFTVLL